MNEYFTRFANTDFTIARGIGPSECVCEKEADKEEREQSGDEVGIPQMTINGEVSESMNDADNEGYESDNDGDGRDCDCLVPTYLSYDCNCQFSANLLDRFRKHFPDLVKRIKKMQFCIPVVHIRDHKESCEYLYGSFYTEGGCHFHGEQAESIWAEFNQLGGRTRQMTPGHRHDVLNDHIGDWNWQKTTSMGEFDASRLRYPDLKAFLQLHSYLVRSLSPKQS